MGFFAPSWVLAHQSRPGGLHPAHGFGILVERPERSSLDLSLSFRVSPHRSRCRSVRQHPPLRFLPLRRFSGSRQLLFPGATNLRVNALSAFLTLSGPSSAWTSRPSFRPVPPMGSYPSGHVTPAEPFVLSDVLALLWLAEIRVTMLLNWFRRPSREGPFGQSSGSISIAPYRHAPLQGVAPRERLLARTPVMLAGPCSQPSWVSPSLGIPLRRGPPEAILS